MTWFYYAGRLITWVLLVSFTRWRVKGKENIPRNGPLLVVANHINNADPPLLAVSINRKTVFMAKEELFRSRFVAYFIRGFGAFPVHRNRADMKALRLAEESLVRGLALVMFPEGKRSHSGRLQAGQPGPTLVAAHSGVPILPVGISGTEQLQGMGWILRRPRITANIGHPFRLPPSASALTKAELAEQTDFIMRRIAELLPEEYRGDYDN